jgi:hypothetical protein
MSHEDVLLYLRTCEVVALCIGFIEFIEIDGKFLARAFSYADDHLGGDVQSDVSDACYAFYLFDAYELFSHFLLGQVRSGRGSGSRTSGLRPRFLGVETGRVAGVAGMSGKRFPSDVCSFIAIFASVLLDVDSLCCLVEGAAAN